MIISWHGFKYDPVVGNENTNGLWLKSIVVDNSISKTSFKVSVELLDI